MQNNVVVERRVNNKNRQIRECRHNDTRVSQAVAIGVGGGTHGLQHLGNGFKAYDVVNYYII